MTSDLLIKNCLIVTMDRERRIIENGHIVIDEGAIQSVSEGQPSSISTDREIDGTGKIAIPGLISTHTHMYGMLSHGIPVSDSPQSFRGFL